MEGLGEWTEGKQIPPWNQFADYPLFHAFTPVVWL
jgi:hypothetical protein